MSQVVRRMSEGGRRCAVVPVRGGRVAGLWSGLALVVVAGCFSTKPPVVDFSSVPRNYQASDYPAVYERWTRHHNVIHDTESVLEVWATFKSRDYRDAFVSLYADAYALSPVDRDHLLQSQRDAADATYEFMLTAQSANFRWNDLEKKSSPWRVTLLDGRGHEMVPEALKIEKLPDMFERKFFPVKTPFTKTYLARFSRATGKEDGFVGESTGALVLRCAGPLGRVDFVWRAAGSTTPRDAEESTP